MKNTFKIFSLTLVLFTSTNLYAGDYSDINGPVYGDELTADDLAENQLQNTLENAAEQQAAQKYGFTNQENEMQPLDEQPLAEAPLQVKTFSLVDSNDALVEKIADETDERNISVSNTTYKRSTGTKAFTYDQIKNVKLNTKFTLSDINVNKDENKFTATLKPTIGDFLIEVSGDFSASIKVPLLVRNINKGTPISQEDIELKIFPKDEIQGTDITEISSIIGKTATRNLAKGKMVSEDEIQNAILVTKNSTVSAVYRTDTIEVKTLAVALDEGGEGDIIRLKNFDSGKVFKAVVQSDGNVVIGVNNKDLNLNDTAIANPEPTNNAPANLNANTANSEQKINEIN